MSICRECGADGHFLDCSLHDDDVKPGHAISPAQLREKVEALNSRMDAWLSALPELPNDVQAMVVRHENELRQAFEVQIEDRARLDAALKRIEVLESCRDESEMRELRARMAGLEK